MTTVTASTGAPTGTSARAQPTSQSLVSSDFDTWLNLLTAQLRNQDPFDPVDSTEYTAQLAQFSAVEQQVKTNEHLNNLVSLTATRDMASMAEWAGKEVRVAAPAAYEGETVTAIATTAATASSAQIVIRDQYGNEVNRFAVPVGESKIEWSGTDATGASVASGRYTFQVESYDTDGANISTTVAEVYAEVVEVQRVDGQIMLVLKDGTSAAMDDVTALRS